MSFFGHVYGGDSESSSDDDEQYEPVTFIRPGGDTEGKNVGWCLGNGFSEIEKGLWSGPWYWRDRGEVPPPDGTRVSGTKTKKSGSRTANGPKPADDVTFRLIIKLKAAADQHFAGQRYEQAMELYDQAVYSFPFWRIRLGPGAQRDCKVELSYSAKRRNVRCS